MAEGHELPGKGGGGSRGMYPRKFFEMNMH